MQTLDVAGQHHGSHAQQVGKHGAQRAGTKLAAVAAGFARPHCAANLTQSRELVLDNHICFPKRRYASPL